MSKRYRSWSRIWGATLLTFLPGGPLLAAEDPTPLAVRKPAQQDIKGGYVYGTVTRLDKDGFSVKGWVRDMFGPPTWPSYRGELDLQPSAGFRAGRFNPGEAPGWSYLPGHLQVGDGVHVAFRRLGGVDTCTSISILRRPGGRVPPSPNVEREKWYEQALGYKYHEYANAHQDLTERGIPLPDKFKPKPTPPLPSSSDLDKAGSPPVKPIPTAK